MEPDRLDFRALATEITDSSISDIRKDRIYLIARDATDNFSNVFEDEALAISTIRSVSENIEQYQTHESAHLLQRSVALASSTKNYCTNHPKTSTFALTFFAGQCLGFSSPYLSAGMATLNTLGTYLLQRQLQKEHTLANANHVNSSSPSRSSSSESSRYSDSSLSSDTFIFTAFDGSTINKYDYIISLLTTLSTDTPLEEKDLDFISLVLSKGFGITGNDQSLINDLLAIRYIGSDDKKFEAFAEMLTDPAIKKDFLEATE